MPELTAIDLFAGAGGSSLGIEQAGFDLLLAADNDGQKLKTHDQNLPTPTLQIDLSDVDVSKLPEDKRKPDYVHGSPPCQGFSTSGTSGVDERNDLVFDFVDWVSELNPSAVSMENVTGLRDNMPPDYLSSVLSEFERAGYNAKARVLNCADYGIPQSRKRLFILAYEGGGDTSKYFPNPTHSTVRSSTLTGQTLKTHVSAAEYVDEITEISGGEIKAQGRTSNAAWRSTSRPSPTITAQGNNYIRINGEVRRMTPDELARLQTFPADWEFTGDKSEVLEQIGNAVPPKMQKVVAEHVNRLLRASEQAQD